MGFPEQLSFLWRVPETPRQVTAPGRARAIQLGGQVLSYTVSRSRRKTVGMSIQHGQIKVVAPVWVPYEEIERILQTKSQWLTSRLREDHQRQASRLDPSEQWAEGAEIRFLGEVCRLKLSPDRDKPDWQAQDRILHLPLGAQARPEQIRDLVHSWLQAQAKEILGERLDLLAAQAGLQVSKFSLTQARTRWGSCTQDGHIRLNWRLVQFGLAVIDYVVAHELAHLRAMDHSPGFWNEVAKILPSYQEGRAQIKGVTLD